MRVAYLYLMKDQPERVRTVAPSHATYWRSVAVPGYQGGPFADRSGGLITFEIDSWRDAEHLVWGDPFVLHDLVHSQLLKEWTVDTASRSA
jgi:hypothetical protein